MDPKIDEVVSSLQLTLNDFRSSERMKRLFCEVIECSVVNSLSGCWCYQTIQRLNAMVNLLVTFLNVPHLSSLLGVGVYYYNGISSDKSGGLLSALQLLLVRGLTLFKNCELELDRNGTDEVFDKERIALMVDLLKIRASPILPYHSTIVENCPDCLKYLSCGVLGVKALSPDVMVAARSVTTSIRKSLFRDSDEPFTIEMLASILVANLTHYLRWLRTNSVEIARLCRNVEVVSSVDTHVRQSLKDEEYSSQRDLVSTYKKKYKKYLASIRVPLFPLQNRDVMQAFKDIRRESFYINGKLFSGSAFEDSTADASSGIDTNRGLSEPGALQHITSLVDAIIHRDQSKDLSALPGLHLDSRAEGASQEPAQFLSLTDLVSFISEDNSPRDRLLRTFSKPSRAIVEEEDCISSNTTDSEVSSRDEVLRKSRSNSISAGENRGNSDEGAVTGAVRCEIPSPEGGWQGNLLRLLVMYIILSASRTNAGGDAFLLLSDLYGGEGLMLCPCSHLVREPGKGLAGNRHRTSSKDGSMSTKIDSNFTRISIQDSAISVTVVDKFDLFPRDAFDHTNPLMRFVCKTETVILLPSEELASQSVRGEYSHCGSNLLCQLYSKLATRPDTVCRQSISIQPELP